MQGKATYEERRGFFLLDVLGRSGWNIAITKAFAGDGVLVVATRGEHELKKTGSVADIAKELFREAMAIHLTPFVIGGGVA